MRFVATTDGVTPPRSVQPPVTSPEGRVDVAAGLTPLDDVVAAVSMLPVLAMKLDHSRGREGEAALRTAVDDLRTAVNTARTANQLPSPSTAQTLATATAEQKEQWIDTAREYAAAQIAAAEAAAPGSPARLAAWRKAVLFATFPVESGAVGRAGAALRLADHLPMVHHVLGPDKVTVTDADLARIDGYVNDLLSEQRDVTLDGLAQQHAFAQTRAGLVADAAVDAAVETAVTAAALNPIATERRRTEVRALMVELAGLLGQDPSQVTARAGHLTHLAAMVHRRFADQHGGALLGEPVRAPHLKGLVTGKLRTADFSWDVLARVVANDKARARWVAANVAVRGVRRVVQVPSVKVRLQRKSFYRSTSDWQIRRVQRMPTMPDSATAVAAEVAEVWAELTTEAVDGATTVDVVTTPGGVATPISRRDVKKLVKARREFYADTRNRGFSDVSDYRSMVLKVLGTGGPVTAQELGRLAVMIRDVRHSAKAGMRRVLGNDLRSMVAKAVVSGWSSAKPGTRPQPTGIDVDHSRLVSAFHAIGELPFVAELTAWLNGIIPLSEGAVDETKVRRKLVSLFAQALDDGSDIPVTVGDRTYDVRLWAIASAPPKVQAASLIAAGEPGSGRYSGKGENRIYAYDDSATTRSKLKGGYLDIGPMIRGEAGVARSDVALTYGQSSVSGRRHTVAVATSTYQFQRIKEKLGNVDLPVVWVARVHDRETRRFKDFTWTDPDGNPQTQVVPYGVAEFMLPLSDADRTKLSSALLDKIDPEYGIAKPITSANQFPLWDFDHAISRAQLADAVLAKIRGILTADDYTFWKPTLESYITNDTLAMELGKMLRPPTQAGFQKTYRRMLSRSGRHLSFSVTPGQPDRPITEVTKISEVSRSLETRFDKVVAIVVKSLLSRDQSSTHRGTLTSVTRFLGLAGIQGRYTPALRRGGQNIRHSRSWLTRAKRLTGLLQFLAADFQVRVDVHHERDGAITASNHELVDGYAHLMMSAATLRQLGLTKAKAVTAADRAQDAAEDATNALDAVPDVDKRRWSPGKGYGLTMDFVEQLGGVADLYNQIVPFMIGAGYLPTQASAVAADAAAGTPAMTPWERLQAMVGPDADSRQRTGGVLNQPGQAYTNWRQLVTELSEEWLIARGDDVFAGDDVPAADQDSGPRWPSGPGPPLGADDILTARTFRLRFGVRRLGSNGR